MPTARPRVAPGATAVPRAPVRSPANLKSSCYWVPPVPVIVNLSTGGIVTDRFEVLVNRTSRTAPARSTKRAGRAAAVAVIASHGGTDPHGGKVPETTVVTTTATTASASAVAPPVTNAWHRRRSVWVALSAVRAAGVSRPLR